MDLTLMNDVARTAHLLGLALGLGVAILADLCVARSLFRPLDQRELTMLEFYHRAVSLGLALFWASGLALLWLRTGFEVADFSPKLMAKIAVVSLLTLNAFLIGRIGLPTLYTWFGFRFGALPLQHRLRLAALAGVSFASWVSALSLGVFTAMKGFDWTTLTEIIGGIYIVGLSGAMLLAFIAPILNVAADRSRAFVRGY